DPVDDLGVDRARERPLQAELLEGLVVDLDDDDVLRRPLAAACAEALVDRAELEAVERLGGVREHAEARDEDADRRQQQPARAWRLAADRTEPLAYRAGGASQRRPAITLHPAMISAMARTRKIGAPRRWSDAVGPRSPAGEPSRARTPEIRRGGGRATA